MKELLRQACKLHCAHTIHRYLMSNAYGRWDGYEKALRHSELCQFYVGVVRGVDDLDTVRRSHDKDYQYVHTVTQQLTDHMESQIGFPLTERPDYDVLIPLFFDKFHDLAMFALGVDA